MSEVRDIRELTLTGLGWTATSRLLQQIVQFGFNIALARLLVPHDFGLIAMIGVFTGFAAEFVDFGLSYALVQRTVVEERHLSTAFWLNTSMGAFLMLVIMGVAPAIAAFYGETQLVELTRALAPVFLIGSLTGVQTAILQREMDFKRLTYIDTAGGVGGSALAVGMALAGFGVWSFVGLALATVIIRTSLLWGLSTWRPRARPDRATFRELWTFSSRLTGFNAVYYWSRNADNLLIGRFVGTSQLAFYARAYSLMLLPLDTAWTVTRPMYSVLSRLKDDHERVKRIYLQALRMIALIMFPAIVGLLVLCRLFILTVYGAKWAQVVPILQILCVAALLQTLSQTTGWLFTSQGRTDWMFRLGLLSSITAICAFFIGLHWGVRGIAVAYTVWTLIITYAEFVVTGRLIGLRVTAVIRSVRGPWIASIAMGGIVWIVMHQTPENWAAGLRLAIGVATGLASYWLGLRFLSPSVYHEFLQVVREYTKHRHKDDIAVTDAPLIR